MRWLARFWWPNYFLLSLVLECTPSSILPVCCRLAESTGRQPDSHASAEVIWRSHDSAHLRTVVKSRVSMTNQWQAQHCLLLAPGLTSHHSHFVGILHLSYIIIILLAGSKSVTINICEIKYLKHMILCKTQNRVNPARCGLEKLRIEPTMLDFHPNEKWASQLTMQIDCSFPFWNTSWLASWWCSLCPRVKIKHCGFNSLGAKVHLPSGFGLS